MGNYYFLLIFHNKESNKHELIGPIMGNVYINVPCMGRVPPVQDSRMTLPTDDSALSFGRL